ncbi:NAD(P)H-hydrate dehydratase [Natranaerobius trueperi]|nr:NAD(P)H-hydrate dehydratase [Natranaerobius trueperi]
MQVVTPKEMNQIDNLAISDASVPGVILMENAANAVTNIVLKKLSTNDPVIVIIAGSGNNGGDGFAIARQLASIGINVQLFFVGKEENLTGDARTNWEIIRKRDDITIHKEINDFSNIKNLTTQADVIIDALLGTGLTGEPREPHKTSIEIVNEAKIDQNIVISVDIPSGVNGHTGAVESVAIDADITITFALPKVGLLLYPAKSYVGKLYVAPIGIPEWVTNSVTSDYRFLTMETISSLIPKRKGDSFKGDFGKSLIIAGSKNMLGAGVLTAHGVLMSGSGLTTLAVPESEVQTVQSKLTEEVMTLGLPSDNGKITEIDEVIVKSYDVIAIGPGLGQHKGTKKVVKSVLKNSTKPLVLDADALNVLQDESELLAITEAEKVVTPHIGEFSRLTGYTIEEIKYNSFELALKFACDWNSVVVLKGSPTIITTPEKELYINNTGNPGMATGGCGDVLTGVITSLIGQGLSVKKASILGVYLHGLAGDLAKESLGVYGMKAGDLVNNLSKGLCYLQEYKSSKKRRGRIKCLQEI